MSAEVLVQPDNPLDVRPDKLRGLVEDLRGIGQDAFIAYYAPQPGRYGVTWWEVVTVWVGLRVSEAVIEQVVGFAVSWMRERFRTHPHPATRDRPKVVRIVKYEGETGITVELVELENPHARAVRKSPEAFEMYTRKKPPIR